MLCSVEGTKLNKPNSHTPSGPTFANFWRCLLACSIQQWQQPATKQQCPTASLRIQDYCGSRYSFQTTARLQTCSTTTKNKLQWAALLFLFFPSKTIVGCGRVPAPWNRFHVTTLVSHPASSFLEDEYNDTIGVFTRYLALRNLMTIASAVLAAVSMHKYQKKLKLHKLTIRSPSPLKP